MSLCAYVCTCVCAFVYVNGVCVCVCVCVCVSVSVCIPALMAGEKLQYFVCILLCGQFQLPLLLITSFCLLLAVTPERKATYV